MKNAIVKLLPLLTCLHGLTLTIPVHSAENSGGVTIQLPEESSRFMEGAGAESAGNICVKCHSADYIYMQPPLTREQWLATILKMRKAYGAPIENGDIEPLVNYLMSQNGNTAQQ